MFEIIVSLLFGLSLVVIYLMLKSDYSMVKEVGWFLYRVNAVVDTIIIDKEDSSWKCFREELNKMIRKYPKID